MVAFDKEINRRDCCGEEGYLDKKMTKNEIWKILGIMSVEKNFSKGTVQNKKYHNLWKKSITSWG